VSEHLGSFPLLLTQVIHRCKLVLVFPYLVIQSFILYEIGSSGHTEIQTCPCVSLSGPCVPWRSISLFHSDSWFLLSHLKLISSIGVIWKGDTLIEGVPETMELLRKMVRSIREHRFFTDFYSVMVNYWIRFVIFLVKLKCKVESRSCFILIRKCIGTRIKSSFCWNKCKL
jgi:hypothetical protein